MYDSGIRTWRHPVGLVDGLFSVRAPMAGTVLVERCGKRAILIEKNWGPSRSQK